MNARLTRLRNRRNRVFRALKRNPTPANLERFLTRRKEFLQLNDELFSGHLYSQAELAKSDPRKFWRLVNNRRRGGSVPPSVSYLGARSSNAEESVDLFASFFHSVFSPASPEAERFIGPQPEKISEMEISTEEVENACRGLDTQKWWTR